VRAGTLFSGIGAPELAAPDLDWRWCAEIDPFACAVLAQRFPQLRNLGDVTEIEPHAIEPVDLLVFGSPCQSFSVAGKRQGMADSRGDLVWTALEIIAVVQPAWIVFENVPGLLSSGSGRDFGSILGTLGDLGYGFAYRILDAQYFGVPQRRRRLFVVACLGDWRPPAAVLFEQQSLRRDPAPRREARQDVTGPVAANSGSRRKHGHGFGQQDWESGFAVAVPLRANGCSTAHGAGIGRAGDPALTLDQDGSLAIAFESRFVRNGRGAPSDVVPPLKARSGENGRGDAAPLVVPPLVARSTRGSAQTLSPGFNTDGHIVAEPLIANESKTYTHEGKIFRLRNVVGSRPRRLTPRECERLQGLPDDWTLIDHRGKPAADGPRYRAIGNSMAVPVMRWILDRLCAVAMR
jgi:DNA (cytosine-5)-methyltransferase 1